MRVRTVTLLAGLLLAALALLAWRGQPDEDRLLHAILSYYRPTGSAARQAELDAALCANFANEELASVDVLVDRCLAGADARDDGVPVYDSDGNDGPRWLPPCEGLRRVPGRVRYFVLDAPRPTFAAMLRHALVHLPGKRVLITNLDIRTDGTLAHLRRVPNWWFARYAYAIARFNLAADGTETDELVDNGGSYDTFVLRPSSVAALQDAATLDTLMRELNFTMGVLGCENRLLWELQTRAGLRWSNPARLIHTVHMHASGVRQQDVWLARVNGDGKSVADLAATGSLFEWRSVRDVLSLLTGAVL